MSGVGEYFTSIFGKSPFKPVQEHMSLCVASAGKVVDLIEATVRGDYGLVESLQRDIFALEGEADELKGEIRSNLPRGFLLPVARGDLLDLLTRQDKIANRAQDISGLIYGRQMAIPIELQQALIDFARVSVNACDQACLVVNNLDELIESSFSGREADRVVEMITGIEQYERESDKAQVDLRRLLFALEGELGAVDVMFLYQIIDLVGGLADIAERVGHRIQMMLAR